MTTTAEAPKRIGASLNYIQHTYRRVEHFYFGPDELKAAFGINVPKPIVPSIFSEAVLKRACSMDLVLVQQCGKTAEDQPFTLRYLYDSRENRDMMEVEENGTILCSVDWYKNEPLYTTETPRPGLFLKGRSVIPESTGKTFIGESLVAADFVGSYSRTSSPNSTAKRSRNSEVRPTGSRKSANQIGRREQGSRSRSRSLGISEKRRLKLSIGFSLIKR